VFSTLSINAAGADGLLYGNPTFFGKEVAAVALASLWAFTVTYCIFFILSKTMTLRVSRKTEEKGLDEKFHGEQAYDA
jgi:Amt family ammonium transporter